MAVEVTLHFREASIRNRHRPAATRVAPREKSLNGLDTEDPMDYEQLCQSTATLPLLGWLESDGADGASLHV